MKFAHDGEHRLAVEQQAAAVHGDFVAGGIFSRAELEITGLGRRRSGEVDDEWFGAQQGKRLAIAKAAYDLLIWPQHMDNVRSQTIPHLERYLSFEPYVQSAPLEPKPTVTYGLDVAVA